MLSLGNQGYETAVPSSKTTVTQAETSKQHFQKVQKYQGKNSWAMRIQAKKIIKTQERPPEEGKTAAAKLNAFLMDEKIRERQKINGKAG